MELLDGLSGGTTPDTGHGFHHKEGLSLSFLYMMFITDALRTGVGDRHDWIMRHERSDQSFS